LECIEESLNEMKVGIVNLRIFSSTILKGMVVLIEILIAQKKRDRNVENLFSKICYSLLGGSF
jgi:hypothetical protein